MKRNKPNGGGAANQAGIGYQNRVAAWLAVRILAEREASPLWGLGETETLEFLSCETEYPVDDLFLETSGNGRIFIQVKHSVTLGTTAHSALASAIEQFARQLITSRGDQNSESSLKQTLDPERDRLILVTTSKSSEAIRLRLPAILARLRHFAPGEALNKATVNVPEVTVLRVVRDHLIRVWQEVAGTTPTESDILTVLRLLWVQVLDVDKDGAGEREAKDKLLSAVVEDTTQASVAWNTLVSACASYAASQVGANRLSLKSELQNAGIHLKAPRSYRTDIQLLRQYSASTLEALKDFSRIRVGMREVKIDRPSTHALRDAAEHGSLVVVGYPGAGKSGTLYDFVELLQGRDIVFFAVERLEARSLGSLRQELGLTHELVEVLENWQGSQPGFLVIDALDAARSQPSARTISDLITDVRRRAPRWHVIVSIRKFDLRHNTRVKQLFAGLPPTVFKDSHEFRNVRHLDVPLLHTEEWLQIQSQSAELGVLYSNANAKLRTLLDVPFNLRLAGELIGEGASVESLSSIKTQIGLLERYWEQRVIRDDDQADAREAVIRRAVEVMIKDRTLRATRSEVAADPGVSGTLHDILSAHILSEWQEPLSDSVERGVLTFAHHILFDYSVARLLFRVAPRELVGWLEQDVHLVMAVRPSIVLHFQYELTRSNDLFWEAIFSIIRSPTIPEIGKLIGPTVAADLMKDALSFKPLARALLSDDFGLREASERALSYLVGALLVNSTYFGSPLLGEEAPPWAELLDHLSDPLRATTVYSVRPVLLTMCQHPENMTTNQQHYAGRIARRFLEFALAQEGRIRDSSLVASGIEAACRTFESDPTQSANVLRRCLEPSHLAAYGYEELFRFGQELERLIPLAPDLVEDIYQAAFTFKDYSNERRLVGGSRIVALTSTPQQNYDLARHLFVGHFKRFLESAPIHAVRALIAAIDLYVEERFMFRLDQSVFEETFDFNGREARIRPDYSETWDDNSNYGGDEKQLQMLNAFQEYMEQMDKDNEKVEERRQIINLIVERNRAAVLWRRLLKCGAAAPQTLGYELRSLGWAIPILLGFDTTQSAGDFLSSIFNGLTKADQERVERAILSIPLVLKEGNNEAFLTTRNRLLGHLPFNGLTTDEAKMIVENLKVNNCVPLNHESEPIFDMALPDAVRDHLARYSVPAEGEYNQHIQFLSETAERFANTYRNDVPTIKHVKGIIPDLKVLHQTLETADADEVDERQCDNAWGYLIEALKIAARCDEGGFPTEEGEFLKGVLLKASEYPVPTHYPEHDSSFDRHPSWGLPAPRVDAAEGIMKLARHTGYVDEELLKVIKRLSCDSVPAVRFVVASNLLTLYNTAPVTMWAIIEQMCQGEMRRGVLQGLLTVPLKRLAATHSDRVTHLISAIFARVREGGGASEVRKLCASIFNGLYLKQDNATCRDFVMEIADHPAEYSAETHQILFDSRSALNLGPVNPPNAEQDAIRRRAFGLIERMVRRTLEELRALEGKNSALAFSSWPLDEQERGSELARIAESICMEIYFASGAYKDQDATGLKINTGAEERSRYLREAEGILEILCEFGYARLTHHLLETLECLISFDPAKVFLRIGRVIRSGKRDFYQYELLAVDLVVGIVERFIAEFRYLLKEDEACRDALIEILDTFVVAGWPKAHRLAYRLEEIFQ
jgi:hypothetical protein